MLPDFFYGMSDPYNTNGKRNIRNTIRDYYNCAGYAFGTFSWLLIGRDDNEHNKIMGLCWAEEFTEALELTVEALLSELPTGWQVVLFDDVMARHYNPSEFEVVAMRLGETDFHFWKLGRNWNWYDKMGASHFFNRHPFESVRGKEWGWRYTSEIICFVRAR